MPPIAFIEDRAVLPQFLKAVLASAFLAACALCPAAAVIAAGAFAPVPFVASAFRQTEAVGS